MDQVTISRELLRKVLDALEAHADIGIKSDKQISALRNALEQPEMEPVSNDLRDRLVAISAAIAEQDDRAAQQMIRELLAAPQAQQPEGEQR